MNTNLSFTSSARSTGGRKGVAEGQGVEPPIQFSAPPEFQGEAGMWTPEHFFTSAVASCYISTFQAIAGYSKFDAQAIEVSVIGELEKSSGGYQFSRVTLRPVLTISDESARERGMQLLQKTEKACLVSRSLRSEIVLEPKVIVKT